MSVIAFSPKARSEKNVGNESRLLFFIRLLLKLKSQFKLEFRGEDFDSC